SIGGITGLTKRELYNQLPFVFEFVPNDSTTNELQLNFYIDVIDAKNFTYHDDKHEISRKLSFDKVFVLNKANVKGIIKQIGVFDKSIFGKRFQIICKSRESVINELYSSISIEQVVSNGSILKLTLRNQSKQKAVDIINNIIQKYNEDAIRDKTLVTKNTARFIDERMNILAQSLEDVEDSSRQFKENYNVVNIPFEGEKDLSVREDYTKNIVDATIQLELGRMMAKYISNIKTENELIPYNLGLSDRTIEQTIETYNRLVLERTEELKTATQKNPKVVNLNYRIKELKLSLINSINNLINSKNETVEQLASENRIIKSRLNKKPFVEMKFRSIEREQEIKETLYLYLMQKREENQIAMAVGVGNAKIVDDGYSTGQIVSPNRKLFFLSAILVSLFLFAIIVYLKELFDDKVYSKSDIEKVRLPYIGNIPLGEKDSQIVISQSSKTAISEAFRTLRTNIDFMLGHRTEKGKFIFVTSTVAKEGKSFTAV
ncbi:MAG: hypothetical protein EBU01_13820, partial [Crocinitomicaceae bacterium]|nr:hypothetical protein [Crocinitomicaceae bacterium]